MKRVGLIMLLTLMLGTSVGYGQTSPGLTAGARRKADDPTPGRTDHPNRPDGTTLLALFDQATIREFNRAWQRASGSTRAVEAVILIVRDGAGSCKAISLQSTNESRHLTFSWPPGTVAVVHTHPNDSDPKPSPGDIKIAERFHVPIFTLTRYGMYLYDPATRVIRKVQDGLDWQEYAKWARYGRAMAVSR